jgi:hypothetical protein
MIITQFWQVQAQINCSDEVVFSFFGIDSSDQWLDIAELQCVRYMVPNGGRIAKK